MLWIGDVTHCSRCGTEAPPSAEDSWVVYDFVGGEGGGFDGGLCPECYTAVSRALAPPKRIVDIAANLEGKVKLT